MISKTADPPAAPSLPQEIIDIITTHFRSDKGILSVLSLVSWSWLHSARRHLFARVELHQHRSPDSVFDSFWRVDFGLEIIKRSPALASCIRFVEIMAEEDEKDLIPPAFQFLSYLPNLRALSLIDIFWANCIRENVPTILQGIATVAPTLEELSLAEVTFVTTADLTAFVRAFPKVKRVSFSSGGIDDQFPHRTPTMPVFREVPELQTKTLICLEHVSIHNYHPHARDILETLLQRDMLKPNLKGTSISWDPNCVENFSVYEKFFHAIGANLHTLELRLLVQVYHQLDAIIQLLSKCRQLSSFSLDIGLRRFHAWFESILETVASSSLKEFTIHCCLSSEFEKNRSMPWAKVDDTLARLPVFSKLKVITHDWEYRPELDPSSRDAVYSELRDLMPRLQQAGMLEIREPEE